MQRRNSKNVGLIGLGIIGRRVAEALRRHGFHVFVWNRTPRPFPNFVGSPVEVAQLCDFVQIFVADDEALLQVIQQLSPGLTAHHIVSAHCTVAPDTMRMAAAHVERRGARFLDAPFTGSKVAAEKGELVYYVGGDDDALEQASRFLEASSREIIEVGEVGQATMIKIATNIVTAATVQAGAEALALAVKSGISPAKVMIAFRHNASHSATLAMKLPKIAAGDFEPHFSVKHMLKDLQLAARLARIFDLDLTMNETARDALLDEMKKGRGEDDYSSVARRYLPGGVPLIPVEPEAQPELISEPVASDQAAPMETETPAPEPVASEPAAEFVAAANIAPEPAPIEPEARAEEKEPAASSSVETDSPAKDYRVQSIPIIQTAAPPADDEDPEERRSLWNRLFRRGSDY